MKPTIIYALVDPRDQSIRYVGKTVNKRCRMSVHRWAAGKGSKRMMWLLDLVKLGLQAEFRVLETVEGDAWIERERYWIKYYRDLGAPLTNIRDGGDTNHPDNEELRKWRSKFMTGHTLSAESRHKISVANSGRVRSAEWREKLSAGMRGRVMPEEQRQRMIGRKQSTETVAKRVAHYKDRGLYKSEEAHQRVIAGSRKHWTGRKRSDEQKAKIRESPRQYWANLTPERKAEIESQTLRRRWA